MDVPDRLVDPEDDETADEATYWCTECGMLFERSCPENNYAWCVRCGTGGVQELPWTDSGAWAASGSTGTSDARDGASRIGDPDESRRE